jgi:hypothetical protein
MRCKLLVILLGSSIKVTFLLFLNSLTPLANEAMISRDAHVDFRADGPNCAKCDKALAELESIDDDTDEYGVHLVKIHDKAMAKANNIKNYPALTYFRFTEPIRYQGRLSTKHISHSRALLVDHLQPNA